MSQLPISASHYSLLLWWTLSSSACSLLFWWNVMEWALKFLPQHILPLYLPYVNPACLCRSLWSYLIPFPPGSLIPFVLCEYLSQVDRWKDPLIFFTTSAICEPCLTIPRLFVNPPGGGSFDPHLAGGSFDLIISCTCVGAFDLLITSCPPPSIRQQRFCWCQMNFWWWFI